RTAQPIPLAHQIVEPVFGQIKAARSFRPFLLRGLARSKRNGRSSAPPTTSSNSQLHTGEVMARRAAPYARPPSLPLLAITSRHRGQGARVGSERTPR